MSRIMLFRGLPMTFCEEQKSSVAMIRSYRLYISVKKHMFAVNMAIENRKADYSSRGYLYGDNRLEKRGFKYDRVCYPK